MCRQGSKASQYGQRRLHGFTGWQESTLSVCPDSYFKADIIQWITVFIQPYDMCLMPDLDHIDSMTIKVIPFQVILAKRSKLFMEQ